LGGKQKSFAFFLAAQESFADHDVEHRDHTAVRERAIGLLL
jgi:hypothetical protein